MKNNNKEKKYNILSIVLHILHYGAIERIYIYGFGVKTNLDLKSPLALTSYMTLTG